jgi:hypothetical protein
MAAPRNPERKEPWPRPGDVVNTAHDLAAYALATVARLIAFALGLPECCTRAGAGRYDWGHPGPVRR